ncbi:MAG: T9SS type A sorting domain-containing protein [Planctomycetota bacterium]|jgi:hypothetical protein
MLIENNLVNVGKIVDTVYDKGTALIFGILVHSSDGNYEHLSNSNYAVVEQLNDTLWEIGFEDLPDSIADWDYDDVIIRVELDIDDNILNTSNYSLKIEKLDYSKTIIYQVNNSLVMIFNEEYLSKNIFIYTLKGKLLWKGKTNRNSFTWNTYGVKCGVYYIRVLISGNNIFKKIILN